MSIIMTISISALLAWTGLLVFYFVKYRKALSEAKQLVQEAADIKAGLRPSVELTPLEPKDKNSGEYLRTISDVLSDMNFLWLCYEYKEYLVNNILVCKTENIANAAGALAGFDGFLSRMRHIANRYESGRIDGN